MRCAAGNGVGAAAWYTGRMPLSHIDAVMGLDGTIYAIAGRIPQSDGPGMALSTWRMKREPGPGHYDKDRPTIIAWVSRQGAVVLQATKDFTVKTVQKAGDSAVRTGSRLHTDSASSYRAACLFALLKPSVRVLRSISKTTLAGSLGFFQCLRNFRQLTAFEQAELILHAALAPSVASRARRGKFIRLLDHFGLLQTAKM